MALRILFSALFNLAAYTIFMALVVFWVFLTLSILLRMSFREAIREL